MFFSGSSTIGVDIGSSAIKVVEVSQGEQPHIKAMSYATIPFGMVENGVFTNQEAIEQNIKLIMKNMGISPRWKKVVMSVSASNTILRRVVLPNRDDDTMEDIAEQEADQHVQMSADEAYLSWHIYEALPDVSDRSVLFAGCAHEFVDSRLMIAKNLKMSPKVVDCDILSIANLYNHVYPKSRELVCIIDMGASSTNLLLLAEGEYLYSRVLSHGGQQFTAQIAAALQIEPSTAETTKIAASNQDKSALNRISEPLKMIEESLLNELKMSINYFFQNQENQKYGNQINSIFLTGAASKTPGLKQAIKKEICPNTAFLDALSKIPTVGNFSLENHPAGGEIFSVATGLALRDDIE